MDTYIFSIKYSSNFCYKLNIYSFKKNHLLDFFNGAYLKFSEENAALEAEISRHNVSLNAIG